MPVPAPVRRTYRRILTLASSSSESEQSDAEAEPASVPEIRVDNLQDSVQVRRKSQSSSGYESLLPSGEDEVEARRRNNESRQPARIKQRRDEEEEIPIIQIDDTSDSEDENTPPDSTAFRNHQSLNVITPRIEEPYCVLCEIRFEDQEACERHELTDHIRPCQCDHCPADFPYEDELAQHVAGAHASFPSHPAEPGYSLLEEVALATTTRRIRKEYPSYIQRVTIDGQKCFDCALCCKGKLFTNLSQHVHGKRHKENVLRLLGPQTVQTQATERPESPSIITIVDRNQARDEANNPPVLTSQLQPSCSTCPVNSIPSASATARSIREPLRTVTRQQEEELSSLLSPITSSALSQREDEGHAFGSLTPFYSGTYITEESLDGTKEFLRFIRHKSTQKHMGFKCLRRGCAGQEFLNEQAAINHHQTAHNSAKNRRCKIRCITFKTKKEWKRDQLAHQNKPTTAATNANGLLMESRGDGSAPLNVIIPAADESLNSPTAMLSPQTSDISVPVTPVSESNAPATTAAAAQTIKIPFCERSDSSNYFPTSAAPQKRRSTSGTSGSNGTCSCTASGASTISASASNKSKKLRVSINLSNLNPEVESALENKPNSVQLPSAIKKMLKLKRKN